MTTPRPEHDGGGGNTMTSTEECPNCHDPVERHTAFWDGCKYCPCGWLPEAQARGALLYKLKGMRRDFVENTRVQEHLDRDYRIPIVTALESAIGLLEGQGVRPLPSEGEAHADCG